MTIEKKLDALIDALGFDVEEVATVDGVVMSVMDATLLDRYCNEPESIDYKLTKRVARGVDMRKEFPNENI